MKPLLKATTGNALLSLVWCLASAHAQEADTKAVFAFSPEPITIDGNADDAPWANANEYSDFVPSVVAENPAGLEDLSARWRGLWDQSNLYLYIEVTDDAVIVGDDGDWNDDSIEFYLDIGALGKGNNPRVIDYGPGFGPNQFPVFQLTLLAGEVTLSNGVNHLGWVELNGGRRSVDGVAVAEENKYRLEVALPWSSLGGTTPQEIIERGFFGFGLAVNDDDNLGGRDTQITWSTGSSDLWHDAGKFPNVALAPSKPSPLRITRVEIDRATGEVTMTWNSRPGQMFLVEGSSDLVFWRVLDDNVAAGEGGMTSYIDLEGGRETARFYRVLIWQE